MTSIARVYVNHIEVGSLPSAQYRAIVQKTRRDWRLYVQQAFNLAWASLRFLVEALCLVPTLWFLVGAYAAIWAPAELMETITRLATSTPEQVSHSSQLLLSCSTIFTSGALVLRSGFAGLGEYGYVDLFDRAIGRRMREVLEVPAEGHVTVCVLDDALPGHEQ